MEKKDFRNGKHYVLATFKKSTAEVLKLTNVRILIDFPLMPFMRKRIIERY